MKIKKTFSLEKELVEKINQFCQTNCINASAMTEKMWTEYLDKNSDN